MSTALTADLRRFVTAAEDDLRDRSERPDLPWAQDLRAEYDAAFAAGRTAFSWSQWRDGEIAQDAVAWVLGTVFVRFCEDNDLIAPRWIASRLGGTALAVDAESAFYADDPTRGTSDWLRDAFGHLAGLHATRGILDRDHSPVWRAPLGDDVCRDLLLFWRQTDPDGYPIHELRSDTWDTRFLGDLYQDLSERAKKQYALLQTPEFVEEFILDQTLTPALAEFPLPGFRLIDPTCGSGHFLLGAFQRLLEQWRQREPGAPRGENVRRALDSVFGVDLYPFAAAIARFRLAVAALYAAGFPRLSEAPKWTLHIAVGDSLLGGVDQGTLIDDEGAVGFRYRAEDLHDHPGILAPGTYHAVVGNPPYITVKDKALNATYRALYDSCSGKYALSVPFMELFFRLAIAGHSDQPGGFVGQITSNSFMKREFGKKLIEEFLSGRNPRTQVDLLRVIDTSGAFIPGHGTPTVIVIGRRRRPVGETVRAVLGKRGEPGQPENPSQGLVWSEIANNLADPSFEGRYVSVTDLGRSVLGSFPWSLSGGSSTAVKQALDVSPTTLGSIADSLGIASFTLEDDVFVSPQRAFQRRHVPASWLRVMVLGDGLRDWENSPFQPRAIWPYDASFAAQDVVLAKPVHTWMWPFRTNLSNNIMFGGITKVASGMQWYEYGRLTLAKLRTPLSIAIAFVATHNHFVLDRGGKVFKQSAPVIKLPAEATEDDHLALLGILNSSTACFWLKQVSQAKSGSGIGRGIQPEDWMDRYEFTGTKLQDFPLPATLPLAYGQRLDTLAQHLAASLPAAVCAAAPPTRQALADAATRAAELRARMIALQEELDWSVYASYGLIDDALVLPDLTAVPGIALGQRAFEIALARQVAAGEEQTAWFDRHGSTPITTIPEHWSAEYRSLVQRRLDAIDANPSIRLLEKPEFKRRWSTDSWDTMQQRAVADWILDRLEDPALWHDGQGPRIQSVAQLATQLRHDEDLREATRVLTGAPDPDLTAVLTPLVTGQAVPYLAAYRYKDSGLRKRAEWERVWDLQRREDAGETVTIPVPPKYAQADFAKATYWAARGKLDVPKERFVVYPGCAAGADPSLVVGWAGWDHAEQARALARLLVERVRDEGWAADQITPVLAGLVELEPWLHQWHSDVPPGMPSSPATAITAMIESRLRTIDATREQVRAWRPPAPARGRRRTQGVSDD